MHSTLYPNMIDDGIVVLKTLLNRVVKPSPQLVIDNKFDNRLQSVVIKFKFQNNLFPCDAAINGEIFEFIKQLLPVEYLHQALNESVRGGSAASAGIDAIWSELLFQKIAQQQTSTNETPLDDKVLDDLRGYLVKLLADATFTKFINAVIKNLPDKIYPDPNNLNIGTAVAKFNGTIVENFDRIRKDGKFLLAADTRSVANYKRNEIRFDKLYFKPYSDVIINYMITSDRLYISWVKSDVSKGYEISEKLSTMFALVHELIHAFYPPTASSKLSTSHREMALAARDALAELGIESKMTNINDHSTYFNAALIQVCSKIKL